MPPAGINGDHHEWAQKRKVSAARQGAPVKRLARLLPDNWRLFFAIPVGGPADPREYEKSRTGMVLACSPPGRDRGAMISYFRVPNKFVGASRTDTARLLQRSIAGLHDYYCRHGRNRWRGNFRRHPGGTSSLEAWSPATITVLHAGPPTALPAPLTRQAMCSLPSLSPIR